MKYLLILLAAITILSCGTKDTTQYFTIEGQTMGTHYAITFESANNISTPSLRSEVEEFLEEFNQQLSTYIDSSTISQFNHADSSIAFAKSDNQYFVEMLTQSKDIFIETEGYYDPTVMPLVNYWGFGYKPKRAVSAVDSMTIDSLLQYVGFDKIEYQITADSLFFKDFKGELDFSAIAKGFAVDKVAELLDQQNLNNYLIDIGGEIITKGKNPKGKKWRLGINTPKIGAARNDVIEYIEVSDVAMASSGNYRNYHTIDGQVYGHTILPQTGYPESNELLGVTVIATNCALADVAATAIMTMGIDKALAWVDSRSDIQACFFTSTKDKNIKKIYSDGFIQYVKQ